MVDMVTKLPISAIVVGFNEGHLLKNSLPVLSFCAELIYVDLGSTDNSVAIATGCGAHVIHHEKVSHVEIIHTELASTTRYDWILITDPDEVLADELIEDISRLFTDNKLDETIGAVTVPIIFYFKDKPLQGTHWGGVGSRVLLVNKDRFTFSALVHQGRKVREGFEQMAIAFNGKNFVHHYWMDSYQNLFKKHLRYLKKEGEARFKTGHKATIRRVLKEPYRAFKYSYGAKAGHKDGITGMFLSLFWAWYEFSAQFRLLRYQAKQNRQ